MVSVNFDFIFRVTKNCAERKRWTRMSRKEESFGAQPVASQVKNIERQSSGEENVSDDTGKQDCYVSVIWNVILPEP